MADVVIYPPTIKTNRQKLYACYSLVRQTIDEYNRQSAIASRDKSQYIDSGKWKAYADEATKALVPILSERNKYIEALQKSLYPDGQWEEIFEKGSIEERHAAILVVLGDKSAESQETTLASSPLLDSLKTISLDSLPSKTLDPDPTEDFTTYTEIDEGAQLTCTADRVTFTAQKNRDKKGTFYKDKGADHFSGDFEHHVKQYFSARTGWCNPDAWGLTTNTPIGDHNGESGDRIHGYFYYNESVDRFYLLEYSSDGNGADTYDITSLATYFHTFKRDEGVGTYGTLYDYLCTGNYYGHGGDTLKDTLTITLHKKADYQFVHVFCATDTNEGSWAVTGWIELLDLQEVAAQPFRSYYPHILAH